MGAARHTLCPKPEDLGATQTSWKTCSRAETGWHSLEGQRFTAPETPHQAEPRAPSLGVRLDGKVAGHGPVGPRAWPESPKGLASLPPLLWNPLQQTRGEASASDAVLSEALGTEPAILNTPGSHSVCAHRFPGAPDICLSAILTSPSWAGLPAVWLARGRET